MKHLRTIFFIIAMAMVLTSCAPQSKTDTASLEAPQSAAVNYSSLAGTYIFETREVEEQYRPALVLNKDGTYRFTVNLFTHMGNIEGTYTGDSMMITLAAKEKDFDGFQGDDVKTIKFDISSGKGLMYRGTDAGEDQPLGLTNPYDLFRLIV